MRNTTRKLVAIVTVVSAAAMVAPAGASNDPSFAEQWGLEQIGAPLAWTRTTGAGVRIGIVDTGVDLTHEDLAGRVVENVSCVDSGGEASGCSGSAQDDFGHGTHVAGIAAATKDNGKGVAGVAPDADLVVAKAFSDTGSASTEDVTAGIKWVVDHGARVVNLSLGEAVFLTSALGETSLADGVEYAWSRGAIPVISSGNSDLFGAGIGSHDYGDLNAVVVAATGRDGSVASYSSPTGNAKWAIAAPGGSGDGDEKNDIYSTYWVKEKTNQYGYLAGTSMAAPQVTGALALILSTGLSPADAVNRLLESADKNAGCGPNSDRCAGRLDVAKAVGAR